MKLNSHNILKFSGIYLLIIIVTNFIYALTIAPGFDGFIFTLSSLFNTAPTFSVCNVVPLIDQIASKGAYCTYNIGFISINIYLAVLSYFLIFKRKIPFKYWIIAFVFLNILFLMFIRLKDYLYAGI